jgi:CheY-like chemotaxis protein
LSQTLILVTDDNEDNRIVFRAILQHAGYAVLLADDGSQALDVARAYTPTLILLDLMMPGLDGWETIARLRADPVTEKIPTLAVSAAVHTDEADLRAAGFCGFVTKPVLPSQLLDAVRQCLQDVGDGKSWSSIPRFGLRETL